MLRGVSIYNTNMNVSLVRHGASRGGYAALITVLIAMGASLTIIGSFTFFALNEVKINRAYTKAIEARIAAESGIEDMTYRLVSGKQTSASETLGVGNATTMTTLAQNNTQRIIRSEGLREDYHQNMEARIDSTADSASFFYGVQVGAGGMAMGSGARVNGNIFSNGSVTGGRVTGDAVVATGLSETPSLEYPAGCTASCGNADTAFATAKSNEDIAQSFTAGAAGPLNKVSVFLGKNGAPAADITLRITADVSGHPASSQISNGSAPVARSSVGMTPSWIDVIFTTPPALTSGTKYWIVLDYSANSPANNWNWRKDSTDGYAGHTGKSAAEWSAKSAAWTDVGGDLAFRLWIGGVNTRMADITVDGAARAPTFSNVSAGGSACPNPSCVVASDPAQTLPISDQTIQGWKDQAADRGTITGSYAVTSDVSLGHKKITGDLNITSNNKTLTVTGTLYVQGNISIDNGSTVRCDPAYRDNSCVILADGWIHIKNNGIFSGSGVSNKSYIMFLSTSPCDGTSSVPPCDTAHHNGAVDLHNNAAGAIFYANRGLINIHNNVAVAELTGYAISMDNNAVVTYESGLADAHFTSGPSGGYDITHWKRTE